MAKELTRLIRITDANLRQSHLYLNGASSFFPRDSFGPSSRTVGVGRPLRLDVEGLDAPVLTDIPKDAKTGRPRGFFRKRSWVREFFRVHGTQAGDTVVIEDTGNRCYAIRPVTKKRQFTAAEFIAGMRPDIGSADRPTTRALG